MRFSPWLATGLVVFAGCLSGPGEDGVDPAWPSPGALAPEAASRNASAADPWGGDTERLLLSKTVTTGSCYDTNPTWDRYRSTIQGFNRWPWRVAVGCAGTWLPEGVVVPAGTAFLTVEADAAGARTLGGFELVAVTAAPRLLVGETTMGADGSWILDLRPGDWDAPDAKESAYAFWFRANGTVSVLEGDLDVRIAARREASWDPARYDGLENSWPAPEEPGYVADGVRRLLEADLVVERASWLSATTTMGPYGSAAVPLEAPIPPGARFVALLIQWDAAASKCAPHHACSIRVTLENATEESTPDLLEEADGYAVYLAAVPQHLEPDNPYADESVTYLLPDLVDCVDAPAFDPCRVGNVAYDQEVPARFVAEAWRDDFDLEAFRSRHLAA